MNQIVRLPPVVEPPAVQRRRRNAKNGTFGVLDIGSTKVVCLVARIETDGEPRVLGFGWQRARGVKAGSIVDLEEAERAIRAAIGQAEEMADQQLTRALVNLSCGQPESRVQNVQCGIHGRAVTEADLGSLVWEARRRSIEDGRETVHAIPLGFSVDATPGVEDPRGMVCETITGRVHIVDAAQAALRNLGAALMRCDMEVDELVSAPFAAGLATLVEDEKKLGCTVIDMGGGATTLGVFSDGHLVHTAQLAVGGGHVTSDLARGLSTTLAHAERLKTLHGGVMGAPEDEKEWLPVPLVGEEEDQIARVPRAMVISIIRPRIEETFELLRDRLDHAGLGDETGRRVVLTGGASQLPGVRELASRILDRQVRLARPRQVRGLPETASGPAFAVPCGMLAWAAGDGRPLIDLGQAEARPAGRFRRLVHWLRERV